MTCACENQLKCNKLTCRIQGCCAFWGLSVAEIERQLATILKVKEGGKRDYIGQLLRGKKKSISKEAIEALAKIFRVSVAYLRLETAKHGPRRISLSAVNDLKSKNDHANATYRMIMDFDSGAKHDHDLDDEMRNREDYSADDLQDSDWQSYTDQDEEAVAAVTFPVVDLVSGFTNPLSHAARSWRDVNPASRKTAVFTTRLVDGEWRVSVSDLAPEKYPFLRTGADDPLFGLTHPAPCPMSGFPADVTLLFASRSAVRPGDCIITLQPADRNVAEMFYPLDPAYLEAVRRTKTKTIWSDVEEPDPGNPREFRLAAWRYVGQHKKFNCMRVTRPDDRDRNEVIIFYDQIWIAVLDGFVRSPAVQR